MVSSFDQWWSVHRLATDRSCLIYSSGSCDVFCQWCEFYLCVQGIHWDKWRSAASSVGWNKPSWSPVIIPHWKLDSKVKEESSQTEKENKEKNGQPRWSRGWMASEQLVIPYEPISPSSQDPCISRIWISSSSWINCCWSLHSLIDSWWDP